MLQILKNIAFSGIRNIDLIDLDTIDVSNLNRQFLFRAEHVGQSKAIIAAQAAKLFNPDLQVNAYHDNIKNARFNVEYFSRFDVVLNALDNVDARRHVNRLCLAASVPLIDSGTTGYLGQVTPILKGITACYECFPKPTQKVFPICTIRSTPDKPVHCIVWAKEAFKLLFGPPSESMLFEDDAATGESSTYMHLLALPADPAERTLSELLAHGAALLKGLFHDDTQKRIDMDVYKTAKITPVPLATEAVDRALVLVREAYHETDGALRTSPQLLKHDWDHQVWSVEESISEFLICLLEVIRSGESIGKLGFDKDDTWAMRFVTAASNLRASIFSIPMLSFHDAKGIAGNIIPAIATTNAIIAGAQTQAAMQLLLNLPKAKLFSGDKKEMFQLIRRIAPHTYCLRSATRRGHLLEPSEPEEPLPACYVCNTAQLSLVIDTEKTTLQELLTKVLKGRLGFNETNIMADSSILYEEGEDCDEDLAANLPLFLANCPAGGIKDSTMLTIEDFSQKLEVKLLVKHMDAELLAKDEATATDMFLLEGQAAYQQRLDQQAADAKALETASTVSNPSTSVAGDDDDDVCIVMEEDEEIVMVDTKRPAEATASNESEPPGKRARLD